MDAEVQTSSLQAAWSRGCTVTAPIRSAVEVLRPSRGTRVEHFAADATNRRPGTGEWVSGPWLSKAGRSAEAGARRARRPAGQSTKASETRGFIGGPKRTQPSPPNSRPEAPRRYASPLDRFARQALTRAEVMGGGAQPHQDAPGRRSTPPRRLREWWRPRAPPHLCTWCRAS